MEVSPQGSHMGLVVYSYQGHTLYKFTDSQDLRSVQNAFNSAPYIGGGTRTDRALENCAEDLFGWVDSGDRPNKPNVLVVLSDGNTNYGSRPYPEAKAALLVGSRKQGTDWCLWEVFRWNETPQF